MITVNFFKRDEVKESKKEHRIPVASFGITSQDEGMIKQLTKRLELEDDYIWSKV